MNPADMRRGLISTAVQFVLLSVSMVMHGQVPGNDIATGYPKYAVFHGTEIESVQVTNGNLHVQIPIWSAKGRGLDTSGSYIYDHKEWYLSNQCYSSGICQDSVRLATFSNTVITARGPRDYFLTYKLTGHTCSAGVTIYLMGSVVLREPNGTKHHFVPDPAVPPGTATCAVATATNTLYSEDGSGWMVSLNPTTQVPQYAISKSGTKVGTVVEDSNGNQIGTGNPAVDTLGRQIYGGDTYVDSAGTQRAATVTATTPVTIAHTQMCGFSEADSCVEDTGSGTVNLPSEITLPNGMKFEFGYEQNQRGEINSITLPTGAQISYTYGPWQVGGRPVASRTVSANGTTATWTYTIRNVNHTTVTDPYNNDTDYDCSAAADQSYPYINPCYPDITNFYTGLISQNNLIKSETLLYRRYTLGLGSNNVVVPASLATAWPQTNQQNLVQWDRDTASVTGGTTTWSNIIEQREYDWGIGAPGPLIRRTDFNYLHLQNSSYRNVNIADRPTSETVYDAAGNTIAQTTYTYDGTTPTATSGAPGHDYTNYSSGNNIRGNLTQVSRWLKANNSWLSTINTYDDLGNVRSTSDPLTHVTSFDYTDNFTDGTNRNAQAYVTKTTYPTTNGIAHVERKQHYFYTGLLAASCGENFPAASTCAYNLSPPQPDYTSHSYDLMNRPTAIDNGEGGQTAFSYNDTTIPLSISTSQKVSSTPVLNRTETTLLDGMGRIKQTQLTSDPDGVDYTDIAYDAIGRVSTRSNPHRSSSSSTDGTTTYYYDAIGRACLVVPPDGTQPSGSVCPTSRPTGDELATYSGNCSTVTDEAGASRASCLDGLGRLTKVLEDPSGSNFETDYGYDVFDNLINVTQKGGSTDSSTWRMRNFAYDSLSRLTCSANPEITSSTNTPASCPISDSGTYTAGTIGYTYDLGGNLIQKKAPAPNQTTSSSTAVTNYSYDNRDRLKQESYTGGTTTPTVQFGYDGTSLAGCTTAPPTLSPADANPIGHRSAMCDGSGATAWSHDVMGRILTEQKIVNGSSALNNAAKYLYYLDDELKTLTYPSSNRVLTYTPNSSGTLTAGRPVSAVDNGHSVNYVTLATYAPQGAIASFKNGASINAAFSYNSRLQPLQIFSGTNSAPSLTGSTCPATVGNIMHLVYAFNLGASDNGNVASVANCRDTKRTQTFTYDSLNRITSAATQNATCTYCWGFRYGHMNGSSFVPGIDPWGNLFEVTLTQGSGTTLSQSVNNKNQFVGMTYDASGNLINDAAGHTYTYDNENRIISTAGTSYLYDGDGERVVKCTGTYPSCSSATLYWKGTGSDPLVETGWTGTVGAEYVFFNGKRVARHSAGTDYYYFSDDLGSAEAIANYLGSVQKQSDYSPYGGEVSITGAAFANNYKFTGKERDSESGLDMFGARYYGSSFGRFITPDWAAKPTSVPYASFGNPQSLNLYSYVNNNPTTTRDPDGHVTGVEDSAAVLIGAAVVFTGAVIIYESQPEQQRNFANATRQAYTNTVDTVKGWFSHPDNTGKNAPPPATTPTNVQNDIPSSESQQGAVDNSPINSSKRPGTLGKPDHQATAAEEAAKYGPTGQTEVTVPTPGGEKGSRRIDAANVQNGKVTGATQVIRPNKNGTPPARETRAAADIQRATGVKPKLVPVRPIKKPNGQ